jgi:hypothetical protein
MKKTLVLAKGIIGEQQAVRLARNGKSGDRAYYRYTNDKIRCAYHCGYETVGGGHVLIRMDCGGHWWTAKLSIRDAFNKADKKAHNITRISSGDITLPGLGDVKL